MIKLIASDLDGTLLPPSKILPADIFPLVETLSKRGILFCPASGRQLPNLQKLFAPVLDKIAIIAENGGLVWYQGKVIYENPTAPLGVAFALDVIRKEQQLYPLLSCTDCAYYESDYEPFVSTLLRSYSSAKKVDRLEDVLATDTVLKISVWDPLISAEHGGKVLPNKLIGLRTMVSGYDWLDVSVTTANKGAALQALMEHIHCAPEQCVAFGDHMNDLEMLQVSGIPYVMENAFPKLKEQFSNVAPSNDQYGVLLKIKELL